MTINLTTYMYSATGGAVLPIQAGGTNAATAADARTSLGVAPATSGTALLKGDGSGGTATVVSGTDIKTVNSTSLLGSGDIAIASKISNVVTATTATTLTSTQTLLQITPASYGVTVTLPDATTCTEGGPLHIIDNKGAYPVRVCDSTGVLKAFIFAGVVSHISLNDNSTAAGVWAIENGEMVGASAQLLTTDIIYSSATQSVSIDIGSGRELLIGERASTTSIYGVVYDRTTNTFGTPTAIRTGAAAGIIHEHVLVSTDKVLVISCGGGATTFEAVLLSISGTTITVNTAATATLSANISAFADGCGLIAVGSSFVTSYTVATPAAQIRALSISGTTVTIGSATVLDGTAGGLIAASSDKVIAVSTATTHLYTKPYTVSGSSLSAGTGTDTNEAANITSIAKFAPLGTRWVGFYADATGATFGVTGVVVSLSGTTTTVSTARMFASANTTVSDAIVIGSNKALILCGATSSNANILTDTAGTASAGTAITIGYAGNSRSCLYVDGTDAYVVELDGNSYVRLVKTNCSGASPVVTSYAVASSTSTYIYTMASGATNAVLSKSPNKLYGTNYARSIYRGNGTATLFGDAKLGALQLLPMQSYQTLYSALYRGTSESQVWGSDASTVITKIEVAL